MEWGKSYSPIFSWKMGLCSISRWRNHKMKRIIWFLSAILVAGCSRTQLKPTTPAGPLTPTVGEMCKQMTVSSDITYLENEKICVTMYQVKRHDDLGGWTFVDVIGLNSQALFRNHLDAEVWARNQPYVRPAWQVR